MIWEQWPLVGREEELQVVKELVDRRRSVVLAGQAGVGKTRLQRELLNLFAEQGEVVRFAVATATASSIPLGALAHLIDDDPDDPSDLLGILRSSLRSIVRGLEGRLIVAVDDAHLLDDLSATLVQQLAIQGTARVVLTLRSGERVRDAISSLWRDGYAERIELQSLSNSETNALVHSAMDGTIAARTLARFWEVSRGNPLFLRELVLGSLEAGTLASSDGVWSWDSVVQTDRLYEIITDRLRGLNDNEREALEVLAFGEPLRTDLFTTLVSADVFASLERKGVLVEREDGDLREVRLVHPLYAEGIRARTRTDAARAIYRSLYDALRDETRTRFGRIRLAVFYLESGGTDVDVLFRGFEAVFNTQDYDLAARFAERVYALEPSLHTAWPKVLTMRRRAQTAAAIEVGEPWLGTEGSQEDHFQLAAVMAYGFTDLGRHDDAIRVLKDEAPFCPDPQWADGIDLQLCVTCVRANRFDEALAIATELLDAPERKTSARGVALGNAATALASTGRTTTALEWIDRYSPSLVDLGSDYEVYPVYGAIISGQLLALAYDGRGPEAISIATDLYRWTVDEKLEEYRADLAVALAGFHLGTGAPLTALRFANEAIDLMRRLPPALSARVGYAAEALALLGRPDDARAAWAARPPFRLPEQADSKRQLGWIEAAAGNLSVARSLVWEAFEGAMRDGLLTDALFAGYDALRLGSVERAQDVADLAERCEGAYAKAVARHAVGIRDGDADALADASVRLEAIGRILCAAEAAAQSSAAYTANGSRGRAATQAGRSSALVARCEGARTPILSVGPKADPLTRREREVAQLAAGGLSNKEISERLYMSVRTVEGHLYQAYAKLGVSGREALGEALSPGQGGQ